MEDDDRMVKLRWPDGSVSDWMPFDRAAFIRAFSFNNHPEIIEKEDVEKEEQVVTSPKMFEINEDQLRAAVIALTIAISDVEDRMNDMPNDEGLKEDLEYFKRHRDDLKKSFDLTNVKP